MRLWSSLRRSKTGLLGLILILFVTFMAVLADFISPYDPEALNLSEAFTPPSYAHPFGTDQFGRDVLSRVFFGARVSLLIGLASVVMATAIGVVLGLVSGFFGGKTDSLIMRLLDIFLSIPSVLLALLVAAVLGPGIFNIMLVVTLWSFPLFARLVRSCALIISQERYIEAARSLGIGSTRIIFRHVLPNAFPTIVVAATVLFPTAILAIASLSFLGLGVPPPTPEWGLMIRDGRDFMRIAWWSSTFPAMVLVVTAIGFNFFGDWLRDYGDPRLKRLV